MVDRVPIDTRPEDQQEPDEVWVPLSRTHLDLVDRIFQSDPSVRAAFETLSRHLFGGGVEIEKPGFTVTPQIQELINGSWARCGREILHSFFVYGFVILRIRNDAVPVVLWPRVLDITVILKPKSERAYRVRDRAVRKGWYNTLTSNPRRTLDDVLVWERYAPTESGFLTSMVMSLIHMNSFLNLMVDCASKAEKRRCVPPLVTEEVNKGIEAKQLHADFYEQGDGRVFYEQELAEAQDRAFFLNQRQEAQIRAANAGGGGSGGGGGVDPITGQPRYPTDESAEPYFHYQVALEASRKVATTASPESPSFLTELMMISEADVGKVTGVPPGLWGSQRSPIAVDQTIMNVFFATQQEHRVVLQSIFKYLFEIIYGDANFVHTLTHYDEEKSLEENLKGAEVQVSLPGLLDPEILMMLRDRGAMPWESWIGYVSKYFGIPRDKLADEMLDPVTDEPMKDTVAQEFDNQMQLKSMGGTGSSGGGGSSSTNPTEKARQTRMTRVRDPGDRTKRPVSSHTGVLRNRTLQSTSQSAKRRA
jgi:hypothetical protein